MVPPLTHAFARIGNQELNFHREAFLCTPFLKFFYDICVDSCRTPKASPPLFFLSLLKPAIEPDLNPNQR